MNLLYQSRIYSEMLFLEKDFISMPMVLPLKRNVFMLNGLRIKLKWKLIISNIKLTQSRNLCVIINFQ